MANGKQINHGERQENQAKRKTRKLTMVADSFHLQTKMLQCVFPFYLFAVIWKDLDLPGLPKVIPTYIVLSIAMHWCRNEKTGHFLKLETNVVLGIIPKGKRLQA